VPCAGWISYLLRDREVVFLAVFLFLSVTFLRLGCLSHILVLGYLTFSTVGFGEISLDEATR
jgi:hypothetical protein